MKKVLKDKESQGVSVEEVKEAIAWVEEYANICTLISRCESNSDPTRNELFRMRDLAKERGQEIVTRVLGEVDGIGEPEESSTGGRLRSRPFIPLSGSNRFASAQVLQQSLPTPTEKPRKKASPSFSPSRSYLRK